MEQYGDLTAQFLRNFAEWIIQEKLTRADVARQLGISRQALGDQLALRKRPNSETLLKMQELMRQ